MIVGISGSMRPNSHTLKTVQQALRMAEQEGQKTQLLDLRTLQLPFCDGSKEYVDFPDVQIFRNAVNNAKGIIIATPEYHGSLSGSLKNALDLLEATHLANKVVAIIVVMGGGLSQGTVNTVGHICRYLNAWISPLDLIIPNSKHAFDANDQLVNPQLQTRLEQLVKVLIEATEDKK